VRRYNFFRPILIILVALFVKNLTEFICLAFGMNPTSAENLSFFAMVIAAVITYMRLMRRN
jgi:hypothetical protein